MFKDIGKRNNSVTAERETIKNSLLRLLLNYYFLTMTWSSCKNSSPFTSTPKRHIFATKFTRIQIGTCGVYYNILRYLSTHDATDTSNILLRIRTVCPNSNRIPWNTMKHSKWHTPDSFSKKINIDQLRTIMIICHWNILV